MATRINKTQTAKAVEQQTKPETEADKWTRLHTAANELLEEIGAPSWQRQLTSLLIGVAAYAGVLAAAVPVINVLSAAVLASSGSVFLATFISMFGVIIAAVAAATAGMKVYTWAMSFEFSNIERRVSGWFRRSEPKPAVVH